MFISGKDISKFLEPLKEKQIQPAGVDLTVQEVFELDEAGEIDFTNESRHVPKGKELKYIDGKLHIGPGAYRINYGEKVSMPKNAIGIVLPRSTLMRMGATIISALWDPGYVGRGQGLLVVTNPHGIIIHKGARVAQIIMISGKTDSEYEGTYKGENL